MATRTKQGGEFCSAIACSSARYKQECAGISFFRFPKNEARCKQWIQNTRRKDLLGKSAAELHSRGYVLCSKHFERKQFLHPDDCKKRLVWDAVPTIFDVPNPPPRLTTTRRSPNERASTPQAPPRKRQRLSKTENHDEICQLSAETSQHNAEDSLPEASPTTSSLREMNLKSKLKVSRNKLYRAKKKAQKRSPRKRSRKQPSIAQRKATVLKELSHLLPAVSVQFIAGQLRAMGKKKKGVRWNEADKTTALSLFHASPKAYRLLKKVFVLPSVRTLQRAVQDIQIYPGFNSSILQALSLKARSFSENSKVCAVIFDEMSIKEEVSFDPGRDRVEGFEDFGELGRSQYVANHATVFMVRGLKENWKQPIGYFLSSGPISSNLLHTLLLQCIDKVEEAGLNVKVVIADQGPNNRSTFTTHLKVTEDNPFFWHKNKKIHVLYDPPHLLKNIRNNLKSKGFLLDGVLVSWQHVENFYRFDKQNNVRLAPKLTERHISLPPFSTLRVRYAAQVLSHSVASGISVLVRFDVLPGEALTTADFLEHFDQLFNSFNSGNLRSSQVMGHAFSNRSGHSEFLEKTLAWLGTVKPTSSHDLPCLSGWKMAIKTLQALWTDLRDNYGFKFILTDRLNQDCLENLFSQIRGNTGRVDNPSAGTFRKILRQVMVDQIISHSDGSNCEQDSSKFLLNVRALRKDEISAPNQGDVAPHHEYQEDVTELLLIATPLPPPKDQQRHLAEKTVLTYIAGFIAKKLQLKVCETCRSMLTGNLSGQDNELLIETKQFENIEGGGLEVPSSSLVAVVETLENVYSTCVDRLLYSDNVKAHLLRILEKEIAGSVLICPQAACDIQQQIVNRFVNVRLHFTLKDSSASFSQKCLKRNRKMMKLSHQ